MRNDPLQPHVRSLLTDRVESVTQLDVLLLTHAGRDRAWTPDEVAAELRIGAQWAEEQLQLLTRSGFLSRDAHGGFRFAPAQDLAATVDDLARAYHTTPVAVVTAIYSKPRQKLKNFADAFRLRSPAPPPTPSPDASPSTDPTEPPGPSDPDRDPSHG